MFEPKYAQTDTDFPKQSGKGYFSGSLWEWLAIMQLCAGCQDYVLPHAVVRQHV